MRTPSPASFSARAMLLAATGLLLTLPATVLAATAEETAQPVAGDGQAGADPSAGGLQDDDDMAQIGDIIVTGSRPYGGIVSDVPADEVLDEQAIASYGASNLSDLLEALSVQTGSGRGRGSGQPVVLVNGRRVSGFREIRNLPPQAIQRMEIFPEEVALDYGYAADQRVVNVVLKPSFSAVTVEVEGGGATHGGRWTQEAEVSVVRIAGNSRINISAEYERATPLTEAERRIIQQDRGVPLTFAGVVSAPDGGEIDPALSAAAGRFVDAVAVPDDGTSLADFAGQPAGIIPLSSGRYRTLLPASDEWQVEGTIARPLSDAISASLNLGYTNSQSRSMLGLSQGSLTVGAANPANPFAGDVLLTRAYGLPGALGATRDGETWHAGASLDGRIGARWRWNVTGNVDRAINGSVTDRGYDFDALQAVIDAGANPFTADPAALALLLSPDRSRQVSQSEDLTAVVNGPLAELPAGRVRATFQTRIDRTDFDSRSERAGVVALGDLGRTQLSASANVDVPVASRDRDVLAFLGDLSVNGRIAYQDVSDFSGLTSWTAGLNWSPVERLDLIATWTGEENAPSMSNLGAPLVVTPLRTIYDFTRGETVLVDVLSGGNPALLAEQRRDFRLQANWRPFDQENLMLTASYARNRTSDSIAGFPLLTPEIEAAFPGRVVRDADGRIVSVDERPVNFAEASARQLRYGVSYSKSFGRPPQQRGPGMRGPSGGGPGGGGQAARGGGPRGPGGPGKFGGNRGGGRWNVAVYHTVRFEDEILIRPGVPVLDLLGGSATGASGGTPRHTVELDGGWFRNGMGVRVNGNWTSGSTVVGGPVAGGGTASDLRFSPQMKINLRAFADLGQIPSLMRSAPFLANTQVRLSVNNLFDDVQEVRDATGVIPLRYQAGYLEPMGRHVELSIRKQF